MLEFCGDKGIEPMVEVMKLSEVRARLEAFEGDGVPVKQSSTV